MRRPDEDPSGSQPEQESMERMPGSTGRSTGASSTGMQDTGSTGYRQSGYQQQQQGYQQPARPADYGRYGQRTPSGRGSALSILAGALAFLMGLSFVIRASFYHAAVAGYAYRWTVHGWGWVLLILGAILVAGGVSNLLGIKGSRQFTAAVAVITAVIAFINIFYSVVWSIVVVAACAFAAHDLLSGRGTDEGANAAGYGGDYGAQTQREREGAASHRR